MCKNYPENAKIQKEYGYCDVTNNIKNKVIFLKNSKISMIYHIVIYIHLIVNIGNHLINCLHVIT